MSIAPLVELADNLKQVILNFDIPNRQFGNPKVISDAADQISKMFDGYVSSLPPKEHVYDSALKFIRNQPLNVSDYNFITGAINLPIKEQGGKKIISSSRFNQLLDYYYRQIHDDSMWRLAWYWLLMSYFSLESDKFDDDIAQSNVLSLRQFLLETHIKFLDGKLIPKWVRAINEHKNLLTSTPCDRYAEAYLQGNHNDIDVLKLEIGIPDNSWFFQKLTLAVTSYAVNIKNDDDFKSHIPKLIEFIDRFSGYRDEAIKAILERYYQCSDNSVHAQLRDYIIKPNVWKNPKLKKIGIASKWHNVTDQVWQMVFSWVTREHLRMFFEIIAGRHGAKKDRFEFWLNYIDQITYTKLIFGQDTQNLKNKNPEIEKLFSEEADVYASLTSSVTELDAFIMQIGDYTFVEFSMNGNAAFIYKSDSLPFKLSSKVMNDKTYKDGLKSAQKGKIIHSGSWQEKTRKELINLNIFPDSYQASKKKSPSQLPHVGDHQRSLVIEDVVIKPTILVESEKVLEDKSQKLPSVNQQNPTSDEININNNEIISANSANHPLHEKTENKKTIESNNDGFVGILKRFFKI